MSFLILLSRIQTKLEKTLDDSAPWESESYRLQYRPKLKAVQNILGNEAVHLLPFSFFY